MEILTGNDLELTFNDTLSIVEIPSTSLYISIYGPESSYEFTWTAEYTSSTTVYVDLTIDTQTIGEDNEIIVLEFLDSDIFTSVYSERGVSPELQLSDYLDQNEGTQNAASFGQTTMVIFLASVFLTVISSFGGNSMELMWNLTNTTQILYFLSKVYVNFPADVVQFFSYLRYSNAKNQYLSDFSFMFVSDSNYKRGTVNDRIEDKAFYVSCADKLPWLFPLIGLFLFIKLIDCFDAKPERKCLKLLKKTINWFKYDFFIRLCVEIYTEVMFDSIVNLSFYDFSTEYEIYSMWLAVFCMG